MSDLDAGGSSAPPGSKVKNKSIDFLVNKLKDTAGSSREGSPEPPSKEQKGRSSRRKPTVTRKVVEDEERLDDSFQEDDSLLAAAALLGAGEPMDTEEGQGDAVRTNGFDDTAESADEQRPEETIDIDEDGNFIVPEGTVVVEPEAVEDKKPEFKGPEFAGRTGGSSSRANKSKSSDILDNLHCSACNRQINPNSLANVKRHPVLQVLLCKRCYTWYTSAELDQDSDGIDEQCRWCGEGGNLVCCDYCSNVFCKGCIKRNLGRAELKAITDSGPDDKWHCYVCDPKPLANIIQECTNIIEAVTTMKEKEKEQQKKHKAQQKTPAGAQDKAKKPKLSGSAQKAKENSANSSKTIPGSMKSNMPTVSNLLMNKQSPQQIVGKQAVKGGIQIVQKQGNKNIVYTLPSGSAVVQQRTQQVQQRGLQQISPGKQGLIPVQKVENTIYRLLAATQSMQLLTTSLKDAFKKTGEIVPPHGTQTQRDVAMQLSRAFTSFKRSLNDIDDYAHGRTGPKAAPAQPQKPQKVVHVSGQLVSQYKGPAPGSGKVKTSPAPAKSVLKPDVGNMASQIIAQAASLLKSKPVATSTPISKSSGPLRVKLPFKGPKKTSEDVICIEDNSDDSPSPQKKGSPQAQKSKSDSGKKKVENGQKKDVKEDKKEVKEDKKEVKGKKKKVPTATLR